MSTILILSQYPQCSRQVMTNSGQSGSGNKGQKGERCGFQVEFASSSEYMGCKNEGRRRTQDDLGCLGIRVKSGTVY